VIEIKPHTALHGRDTDGSDLDLLVDPLPGTTLFDLGGAAGCPLFVRWSNENRKAGVEKLQSSFDLAVLT